MTVQQATVKRAGNRFLVWSIEDIVWLRSKCHLAVTPIGACPTKLATRGKAAAVPVLLSDEDLFTTVSNGWVRILDHDGREMSGADALAISLGSDGDGRQTLRRLVHRDLTAKGYALTNGLKFGVDFLAYKGDPTAVHAAYMVIVAREDSGISALDLVARSRVATTALKMAVMAWADPTHPQASVIARAPGSTELVGGAVHYAVFKRMGPGSAIFSDASAQQSGAEWHAGTEWQAQAQALGPAQEDAMQGQTEAEAEAAAAIDGAAGPVDGAVSS